MIEQTQPYKRSISGSIGAGMSSVFGGGNRRFYTLVHKTSTAFHKMGENQRIIIDEIELGRDPKCQVRFDEEQRLVSRRHAAIVKAGEGKWKIIPLSQTNSTLVNGIKLYGERMLNNGDEIQLAVGGPVMGFVALEGDSGKVSSIGLTARLNLFGQQALRPYKTAVIALASVLVFACGGLGYGLHKSNEKIGEQNVLIASLTDKIKEDAVIRERENARRDSIDRANYQKHQDEIAELKRRIPVDLKALVSKVESSVYYLETVWHVEYNGQEYSKFNGGSGTGFLLDDGKFVTARHCVNMFYCSKSEALEYSKLIDMGCRIYAEILAINKNGDIIKLLSSDFKQNSSYDVNIEFGDVDENGWDMHFTAVSPTYVKNPEKSAKAGYDVYELCCGTSEIMWSSDWAYANTGRKGLCRANADLSRSLTKGTDVLILGFPKGFGVDINDGLQIEPVFNKMSVAKNGLEPSSGCILFTQGIEHGNSGGPVFAVSNGSLYVVGIVSRLDADTEQYCHNVPICNIY